MFSSKLPRIADTELEAPGAAAVLIVMNRDAVIQPERTDRQVQPQAKAPVVAVTAEIEIVGFRQDVADVVEHRDAHADTLLFLDDGDAVFGAAKPVGVAADGFAKAAVVAVTAEIEIVGFRQDVADVVEHRDAHADTLLFLDDGDAVFGAAKPVGVAAD